MFAPVEDDGRMLVDGGLSSNLPIDVAREMGVDVLIVVDCGFPLLERNKLDSVATVSNQMLAILIRHNTSEQRKTLTDRDVIIDPALGDFSSLDFSEHAKAMKIGEQAARGASSGWRRSACRPRNSSASSRRARRSRTDPPRIDFLRVEPGSERYADAIDALFGDQVGKTVDRHAARQARQRAVRPGQPRDLRLPGGAGRRPADPAGDPAYGLGFTTRRNSWGPNYLRFGLQLQNDFEGNSSFNAAMRGTLAEITKYGGEWVWDLQVGETPRVATEVYLPVGYRSRWFVAPHAQFQIRTLPVADENENILAEYRVRSTDFGVDFGRELGNYGEVRVGWGRSFGESQVRVGDPILAIAGIRFAHVLRRVPLRQRR